MNLNKLFLNYCKKNNLEVNPNQINLIEELNNFYLETLILKTIYQNLEYKTYLAL